MKMIKIDEFLKNHPELPVIDEDEYNLEKTVDFKLVDLIKKTRTKNKSGYRTPGSKGCYYHLAVEPRYYYDPSF